LKTTSYKNTVKLELPKGKKNKLNEPNIFTAIREMEEETQIKFDDIDLMPRIKRTMTEVKNDIKYLTIFYVAVIKKNKLPHINESCNDQLSEIGDVRLVDMNILRNNIDINIYNMIKDISKQLKVEAKHL
jgi:8-oxo-dGTP pyrophosphatase MutT (NUDIX family)